MTGQLPEQQSFQKYGRESAKEIREVQFGEKFVPFTFTTPRLSTLKSWEKAIEEGESSSTETSGRKDSCQNGRAFQKY